MSHLTYYQIQAMADGSIGEPDRQKCQDHAALCSFCAREIALQQFLIRAIGRGPLVKTSRGFTRTVMEQILPGSNGSALLNFLGGAGKFLAMGLVLAVITFALTRTWSGSPLTDSTAESQSQVSGLISRYYGEARQFLAQSSGKAGQTMIQETKSPESKILAMIFLSLGGLALIDRYVFKTILKMKL